MDKITRTAALTLEADIKNRVFQDGEASNESLIGNYSEKDMLVGSKSFILKGVANKLLGSKGKRRKLQWVTKNGKKLAVLPGGYKTLRSLQERQVQKVDLHMTGKLLKDFTMIGKNANYFLGFTSEYGKTISLAQEERFGKRIFASTDTERKMIVKLFKGGINLVLQ